MDIGKSNAFKKYIVWGITLITLIVSIPLLIDHLIIGNSISSNIDNKDWVSFLGSYASLATLAGIWMTIQHSAKQTQEDRRYKRI